MSKTFAYLGLATSIIFIFFGVIIWVSPPDNQFIQENNVLVSIVVLLYGLFRLYRSLRILRGHDGPMNLR